MKRKIEKLKADRLETFTGLEIVKEINQIVDTLREREINQWTPDQLSRSATKLSLLLVNLGQYVAEASLEANSSYAYRKFKFATEYKKIRQVLDNKVKDSELQAQENIQNEVAEEITAQYYADLLKTLYDDTSRLVMVIQSRLRQLNSESIRNNDKKIN